MYCLLWNERMCLSFDKYPWNDYKIRKIKKPKMKNIIKLLCICCFALYANCVQAQEFSSAIGARLGYPLSASFKRFISESSAVEVYIGTRSFGSGFGRYRWWTISGGYQIHKPIEADGLEGLSYYYGAGVSVFFWNFDNTYFEGYATTTIGTQGYAGLSYSFENVPINLTVDWVPTYFINGFGSGFGAGYGTVGVRYILSR